jgi:hypothetical protein
MIDKHDPAALRTQPEGLAAARTVRDVRCVGEQSR